MDCIIFNFEKKILAELFLKRIQQQNIVTKNIPDALEWHFAKYWDHIFKSQNRQKLLKSFPTSSFHLEKSIAIFIYASEKIAVTKLKAQKIEIILKDIFAKS